METSIQDNNQINTGQIRGHIMVRVEMQQACQHFSINMVITMLMDRSIIIIEKRNDNTRNGSTKINAKNKFPVRNVFRIEFTRHSTVRFFEILLFSFKDLL